MQQNRNDADVALQAGSDLQSNQVILVGEAPASLFIRRGEPTGTNQNKHDIRYIDLLTHGLNKIFAGLDGVDVAIDALFAEMLYEAIK